MITGLVARPWCLMEICSKQEIVNIVTDPNTETTKIGLFSSLRYYDVHNCLNFVDNFVWMWWLFNSDVC